MIDEVNQRTSSWANASRVVLDTPIGKVRRENIESWNKETGKILFRKRDGRAYAYPDFPKELDEPGDITKLLWKR